MNKGRESRLGSRRETLTADQIIAKVRDSSQPKPAALEVHTCTCGCGQPIPSRRKRSLFLQGHDAKLKSFLIRVLEGQERAEDIPKEAIERRDHIGFLKTRHELRALLSR